MLRPYNFVLFVSFVVKTSSQLTRKNQVFRRSRAVYPSGCLC